MKIAEHKEIDADFVTLCSHIRSVHGALSLEKLLVSSWPFKKVEDDTYQYITDDGPLEDLFSLSAAFSLILAVDDNGNLNEELLKEKVYLDTIIHVHKMENIRNQALEFNIKQRLQRSLTMANLSKMIEQDPNVPLGSLVPTRKAIDSIIEIFNNKEMLPLAVSLLDMLEGRDLNTNPLRLEDLGLHPLQ